MLNIGIIVATCVVLAVLFFLRYRRAKKNEVDYYYNTTMTFDKLFIEVKNTLADLVKEESFAGMTEQEYDNAFKRRTRVQDALKKCVYGIDSAKIIVIDLIREIIIEHLPDKETIQNVVQLEGLYVDPRIQFEVLLYKYKKLYRRDALSKLIEKYSWDRDKYIIEDKEKASYAIEADDVRVAYAQEDVTLEYPEMLDIVAVLLYQKYKGFGHVDTIHEMNINGYNFGTSGSILSGQAMKETARRNRATNSLWLYFRGKYIHLKFIDFGSEEEIRRCVQLICRYNSPGQLTEKKGYIVNTMFDKSRVLAVRPPLAEYWAVFVRKFALDDNTVTYLIKKEYTHNAELAIAMMRFLMLCQITTAVTGRQGSGKTTLMIALVEFFNPKYNVRTIEMAFELYLREIYPERNILSLQETMTISMTEAQDALKKSDAAITMVGEVASDPVASNVIQLAQVASLFTLFSHHANKAADLIAAFRNSLVNAKGYDPKTAMDQVLEVIHMDIHLDYNTAGQRYIERISEIIPLPERAPYPHLDRQDFEYSAAAITREYYQRATDRERFITRDLIVYDKVTHTYKPENPPSERLLAEMIRNVPLEKRNALINFIKQTWNL